MSSASIGGTTGSSLYQFFQSIAAKQSAQQSSATTAASSTSATSATDPTTDTTTDTSGSSATQAVSGHHGHHGGHGGGAMFKKIDSAVTSALQSAQSDGSDPNQTVEDAIAKVLGGTSSTTDPSTQQTASGTDTDGTTSDVNGQDATSRQAFFNTLQQYGIDPQQFRQDLMSAVQQAHGGGQVDPSTAFKSFPPGVAVDVAA